MRKVSHTENPRVYITDFLTGDLAAEKGILSELAEVQALGAEREEQLKGRIEDAACLPMNLPSLLSTPRRPGPPSRSGAAPLNLSGIQWDADNA